MLTTLIGASGCSKLKSLTDILQKTALENGIDISAFTGASKLVSTDSKASVSGTITDVTGAPISGVLVSVVVGSTSYIAYSDSNGSYTVPVKDMNTATELNLVAQHGAYQVGGAQLTKGTDFATDATSINKNFTLIAKSNAAILKGEISGKLVMPGGFLPIKGATLTLTPISSSVGVSDASTENVITVITDENGNYAFTGIPVGNYSLQVSHTQFDVDAHSISKLTVEVTDSEAKVQDHQVVMKPKAEFATQYDLSKIGYVKANLLYNSNGTLMTERPAFFTRATVWYDAKDGTTIRADLQDLSFEMAGIPLDSTTGTSTKTLRLEMEVNVENFVRSEASNSPQAPNIGQFAGQVKVLTGYITVAVKPAANQASASVAQTITIDDKTIGFKDFADRIFGKAFQGQNVNFKFDGISKGQGSPIDQTVMYQIGQACGNGSVVKNALVKFVSGDKTQTVTAGPDGHYFVMLAPGPWVMDVYAKTGDTTAIYHNTIHVGTGPNGSQPPMLFISAGSGATALLDGLAAKSISGDVVMNGLTGSDVVNISMGPQINFNFNPGNTQISGPRYVNHSGGGNQAGNHNFGYYNPFANAGQAQMPTTKYTTKSLTLRFTSVDFPTVTADAVVRGGTFTVSLKPVGQYTVSVIDGDVKVADAKRSYNVCDLYNDSLSITVKEKGIPISGYVLSNQSGPDTPIAGATVKLTKDDIVIATVVTTLSDDQTNQARFKFTIPETLGDDPAAHVWKVKVSKGSLIDETLNIFDLDIRKFSDGSYDAKINHDPSGRLPVFASGFIGTTRDMVGQLRTYDSSQADKVKNAIIEVSCYQYPDLKINGTTNSNGQFSVSGLPENVNNLKLIVTKGANVGIIDNVFVQPQGRISLESSQAYVQFQGFVLDTSNIRTKYRLGNSEVLLGGVKATFTVDEDSVTVTSNADGTFPTVCLPRDGNYRVTLSKTGFRTQTLSNNNWTSFNHNWWSQENTCVLIPENTSALLAAADKKTVSINFKYGDGFLRGVWVTATLKDVPGVTYVVTANSNSNGDAALSLPAVGEFRLAYSKTGYDFSRFSNDVQRVLSGDGVTSYEVGSREPEAAGAQAGIYVNALGDYGVKVASVKSIEGTETKYMRVGLAVNSGSNSYLPAGGEVWIVNGDETVSAGSKTKLFRLQYDADSGLWVSEGNRLNGVDGYFDIRTVSDLDSVSNLEVVVLNRGGAVVYPTGASHTIMTVAPFSRTLASSDFSVAGFPTSNEATRMTFTSVPNNQYKVQFFAPGTVVPLFTKEYTGTQGNNSIVINLNTNMDATLAERESNVGTWKIRVIKVLNTEAFGIPSRQAISDFSIIDPLFRRN